jgi:hypothetical protein
MASSSGTVTVSTLVGPIINKIGSQTGPMGRAELGYRFALGTRWYLSLGVAAASADLRSYQEFDLNVPDASINAKAKSVIKIDYTYGAFAALAFDYKNMLFAVKFGPTVSHINSTVTESVDGAPAATGAVSRNQTGWLIGLNTEQHLGGHFSMFEEGDYIIDQDINLQPNVFLLKNVKAASVRGTDAFVGLRYSF